MKVNEHGQIVMAPKKWPEWYAYMEDCPTGNVRAWDSDPGVQGWWILTPQNPLALSVNVELKPLLSIQGGAKGTTKYTVEMEHGVDKNTYTSHHSHTF